METEETEETEELDFSVLWLSKEGICLISL
jgi:hypothetical protein